MSRYQIDTDVLSKQCKVDDNHLWGRELRFVNEYEYCCKLLELTYSARSSLHHHDKKRETFIILSGVVTVRVEDTTRDYRAGEQVTIYPGQRHSFMMSGTERALILEVSMHHDDEDTYRAEPSVGLGKIPSTVLGKIQRKLTTLEESQTEL